MKRNAFDLDSLAKGLVDTETIEKRIDKKTSKDAKNVAAKKAPAKKSPSKRSQRYNRRGRGGPRNMVEVSESDSDLNSDSDDAMSAAMNVVQHRARPRDPNTIYLDCDDDEFMGGPAVNVTRNIAGANCVSQEQSQEMKVNVKISGKIEHFQTNPVS